MGHRSNIDYLKRVERGSRKQKAYRKRASGSPYIPPRELDVLEKKEYLFASKEKKKDIRAVKMSRKLTDF